MFNNLNLFVMRKLFFILLMLFSFVMSYSVELKDYYKGEEYKGKFVYTDSDNFLEKGVYIYKKLKINNDTLYITIYNLKGQIEKVVPCKLEEVKTDDNINYYKVIVIKD